MRHSFERFLASLPAHRQRLNAEAERGFRRLIAECRIYARRLHAWAERQWDRNRHRVPGIRARFFHGRLPIPPGNILAWVAGGATGFFSVALLGWLIVSASGLHATGHSQLGWNRSRQAPGMANPPDGSSESEADKAAHEAALERIRQRMDRYAADANQALEASLATLDGVFQEAKNGSAAFADSVLGAEGKLRLTFSGAEQGVRSFANGVYSVLTGNEPGPYTVDFSGPDQFVGYVEDCFRRQIVSHSELEQAIQGVVNDYLGRLGALESALLIELRADLPDDVLKPLPLPPLSLQIDASASVDRATEEIVQGACDDLGMVIGKFVLAWIAGDAVQDSVTDAEGSAVVGEGVNFAAGLAFERSMEAGLQRYGYDPQGRIRARIDAALDANRITLVDGTVTENTSNLHFLMLSYAHAPAGPEVSGACLQAAQAMEAREKLGLRRLMQSVRVHRQMAIAQAIAAQLPGLDGEVCLTQYDPTAGFPPMQALEIARTILTHYQEQE